MLYSIGDIHGMRKQFEKLWDLVGFTKEDTIVTLGDYIDRGPDSKGVIDDILDRQSDGYNIITLMGNHEQMAIASIEHSSILGMRVEEVQGMWLFPRNGGPATLNSFGIKWENYIDKNGRLLIKLDAKYMRFMKSCKLLYETEDYIFVHAGLRPYKDKPMAQHPQDMLWIREPFIDTMFDFGRKVVFGHTPTKYLNSDGSYKPYKDQFKIGIDTGCVFGHSLTCVRLPGEEFISV